jgi:hypothetical protein
MKCLIRKKIGAAHRNILRLCRFHKKTVLFSLNKFYRAKYYIFYSQKTTIFYSVKNDIQPMNYLKKQSQFNINP